MKKIHVGNLADAVCEIIGGNVSTDIRNRIVEAIVDAAGGFKAIEMTDGTPYLPEEAR